MFLTALAFALTAHAQEPSEEGDEPDAVEADAPAPATVGRTRSYLMEVNARGRYLWTPKNLVDVWYFRHDGAGDTTPERPNLAAYATGLEYVVKNRQANGIFYVEYLGLLVDDGYWDDVENPADDLDGSFIASKNFGLVTLGADYAYEAHARPWLSFLFGGGLGIAIKTGELVEWEPGEDPANGASDNTDPSCGVAPTPAYEREAMGCPDDGALRVPPVLPMLDINLGVRFNVSDRASLRLEGGLHDLPYAGGALGVTF